MATNIELLSEAVYGIEGEENSEAIIEAFENGELLTFAEWKKRGYSVRKGQKAVFSCQLWKKTAKKAKSEDADKKQDADEKQTEGAEKPKKQSNFVKTKCFFFLPSQVEKIGASKAS